MCIRDSPYAEDNSEIVHYPYWEEPATLQFREELPGYINEHVIKDGVIASLLRRDGLRLTQAGNSQAGSILLNESRRQETLWRGRMIEAVIDEGAIDDASVVIYRGSQMGLRDDFFMNAFDQVWYG